MTFDEKELDNAINKIIVTSLFSCLSDTQQKQFYDWRIRTDSMVERYENSGIQAVKVVASTYDFITWCQAHGRDISTKSCNDYAVSESGLQILRDREFDWGDE